MKKTILVLTLSLLAGSTSMAKQLLCQGSVRSGSLMGGVRMVEVRSSNVQAETLYDIMTTVQFESYKGLQTAVGRRNYISIDEVYNPRVYVNHSRYDLRQLTDVKDFSPFMPADQCRLSLMIPNGVTTAASATFAAPMVVNCDQGGGSMTLQCRVF